MTSETIIPDVISENEPFTKILSIRVDVESDSGGFSGKRNR